MSDAGSLRVSKHTEVARVEAVRRYEILDTPEDGTFDALTALAARVFNVPIAIVSIVDTDRIWFKSRHGLDVREIERHPGLCDTAIQSDEQRVLPDARLDPLASTNPLVTGSFGLRFYAAAPLVTGDGHRLGTVCVIDRSPRVMSQNDLDTLRDLAKFVVRELDLRLEARRVVTTQTQLREAAEAAMHASDELADALQSALLPPRLPHIRGVELAACYQPAPNVSRLGGDFYDIFPLPRRAWGIVIGDVCGKGPRAASVAGAARYSLRNAALEHQQPANALRSVNETLLMGAGETVGEEPRFCTMVFARLRPHGDGFQLSVACGGHPPPQLMRADGSMEPLGGPGCIIGVLPDAVFSDRSTRLRTGDTVVFFTDGITEARCGEDMLEREGLLEELRACRGQPPRVIVERLTKLALSGGNQRDDIAVVALRINGAAPPAR